MGSAKSIRGGGGANDGQIVDMLWKPVREIDGIKVLHNPNAKRGGDLPIKSNSSDYYFKQNASGDIIQLRAYDKKHNAKADIDINPRKGHNADAIEGVTHIHRFVNGKRLQNPSYLTDEEIKKYDSILRKANPNVKYKPN